jgi:hypothetical protein
MPRIRIAQCPYLLLITLVAVLAADGRARGGSIVNGGFETGDFAGWSTLGNASVVDASFQTGPALGQYQALVSSAIGSVDVGSLEGALNLGPGSLSGLGAVQGSAIWQTVTLNQGDLLRFSWDFLTTEDTTQSNYNNDFAFYTLTPTSAPGALAALADVNSSALFGSFSQFVFEEGYFQNAIPIQTSGTYRLGFGVVDVGDSFVESGLLIDGVSAAAVPEPRSLVSFGIAAGVLGIFAASRWRRHRPLVACA